MLSDLLHDFISVHKPYNTLKYLAVFYIDKGQFAGDILKNFGSHLAGTAGFRVKVTTRVKPSESICS